MNEPKPIASLSSMLLARKGAARPAMRRQPIAGLGASAQAVQHDDLGWNDMGYDVDPAGSTDQAERIDLRPHLSIAPETGAAPHGPAVKPEVVRQQDMLATRIDGNDADAADDMASDASASADPIADAAMAVEPDTLPALQLDPAPVARAVAPVRRPRAAPAASGKAAFTLRLDSERHLRLRLASAIGNRSAQHILIDLLDAYLSALPEIEAMASRLPAVRSS